MKAARFYGALDLRIEDVPIPVPKGDEVLVAVEWCGICGSDLHEYLHGSNCRPYREYTY
jgi:threonine dehydrogenase-like Zn-dependent dehydrogenase